MSDYVYYSPELNIFKVVTLVEKVFKQNIYDKSIEYKKEFFCKHCNMIYTSVASYRYEEICEL